MKRFSTKFDNSTATARLRQELTDRALYVNNEIIGTSDTLALVADRVIPGESSSFSSLTPKQSHEYLESKMKRIKIQVKNRDNIPQEDLQFLMNLCIYLGRNNEVQYLIDRTSLDVKQFLLSHPQYLDEKNPIHSTCQSFKLIKLLKKQQIKFGIVGSELKDTDKLVNNVCIRKKLLHSTSTLVSRAPPGAPSNGSLESLKLGETSLIATTSLSSAAERKEMIEEAVYSRNAESFVAAEELSQAAVDHEPGQGDGDTSLKPISEFPEDDEGQENQESEKPVVVPIDPLPPIDDERVVTEQEKEGQGEAAVQVDPVLALPSSKEGMMVRASSLTKGRGLFDQFNKIAEGDGKHPEGVPDPARNKMSKRS